jgi:TetR/AcrR family transcriptional regulator, cholesterol catabolism regulator
LYEHPYRTVNVMKEAEFGTQIKNLDLVQKRRLQIAMGASKLFTDKGYFKTNMRDISKATGITIGSLYDYITKKEDILCLVFDVFHALETRELEESGVFQIEDPVLQLKAAMQVMLEFGNRYRDMVVLMYRESKSLPKDFLKAIMEKENEMVKCFEGIVQRGVDKGVFKVKDPFFTGNIIAFLMAIEPLRGWNLRKGYSVKEIHQHLTDFVLDRLLESPVKDEEGAH